MKQAKVTEAPAEPRPADPPAQNMALARVQSGAVGAALSVDELKANLDYIKTIMQTVMVEGTDYGKIPGTGDKPTLLQPGAQKLLMTFQLTEEVKKEVLREFPGKPLHREYEFTVCVTSATGKSWDGVGSCSTLEKKYAKRKGERKCPSCGAAAIIKGNKQYGGGWLCWAKKGGCGAKFEDGDQTIERQEVNEVENPDLADTWNTVRKMAFKRALVAAAINATNTSQLWTQDLDDNGEPPAPPANKPSSKAPPAKSNARQPDLPNTQAKPKTEPAPRPTFATEASRAWLIRKFADVDVATEFFIKLGQILPTETIQDLPLRFVPINMEQTNLLLAQFKKFEDGEAVAQPFPPNKEPEPATPPKKEPAKPAAKPATKAAAPTVRKEDPEWFMDVICPIPRKGQKKAEYDKEPDSIGSLYEAMKGGDEAAQKRLWGFAKHWQPAPHDYNGKTYQPSKQELLFREALDAFCDWHDKHGQDADPDANEDANEPPGGWQGAASGREDDPERQERQGRTQEATVPHETEDDIPY